MKSRVYESDIAESIFEVIANTSFKDEGEIYLENLRALEDINFSLNKANACIEIETENEVYQIRVTKTHQLKP
jgi:hypothetical protein